MKLYIEYNKSKNPNTDKQWEDFLTDPMFKGDIKIEIMHRYFDEIGNNTSTIIYIILLFQKYLEWARSENTNMFKDLIVDKSITNPQMGKIDYRYENIGKFKRTEPSLIQTENQRKFENDYVKRERKLLAYKNLFNNWNLKFEHDRFQRPFDFLTALLEFYQPNPETEKVQIKWNFTAAEFCYLLLKLEEKKWIQMPSTKIDAINSLQKIFIIPSPFKKKVPLKNGTMKEITKRADFGNLKNEFNINSNSSNPVFKRELDLLNDFSSIFEKKVIEENKKRKKKVEKHLVS